MKMNRNLLVVDDEPSVISSLKRFLRNEDYSIFTAESGAEGLEILRSHDVAVVLSDLNMPEMDGLALFEEISHRYPNTIKILLTAQGSLDTALQAINRLRLYGYLTKPWPAEEIKALLGRAFEHYHLIEENKRYQVKIELQNNELAEINEKLEDKVRQRTEMIEDALKEGIMMLATAAEAKDEDTGDHIMRIRHITNHICNGLGLPNDQTETISLFSVIHDVGKLHIPDRILNKPGPLDTEEWVIMKGHCKTGERILGKKKYYAIAREIARSHHENWDGSGYPDGLKVEDIPLSARIVSIADVFDALTHKRSYKEAWTEERAIQEMKDMTRKKFDPKLMGVFLRVYDTGELSGLI